MHNPRVAVTQGGNPEIGDDLLDDFYAECDELLGEVRSGLTSLEQNLPAVDVTLVGTVFRHVHTLKGNAAIVGLHTMEQLAHRMEDVLRAVTRHTAPLQPADVDTLLAGTQRLEQIVVAHRQHRASPPIDDILRALGAALAAAPGGAPATPAKAAPTQHTVRAHFEPSRELDRRGVNVTSVRARLAEIGEITQAAPNVKPNGAISFTFTIRAARAVADPDRWLADGIRLENTDDGGGAKAVLDTPVSDILSLTPTHLVRVNLARLDDLMRITGELVIHRSRLEERINQNAGIGSLRETTVALSRSLRELRSAVSRVRMVPVAEIFARMPFVVRDLMRGSDKTARVLLEGQQTEVDKYLVERLKEPLLHLVRNSFSHGIEPADEREQKGKPRRAEIALRARSVGDSVEIRAEDDGRGIDPAMVAARARASGLTVPEVLNNESILRLLCAPGFSTREDADRESGRGVGMAVVADTLRELGGSLTLETEPGRGTTFILRLPLSLSITDAIILNAAGQTCAVPQGVVQEIFQCASDSVRSISRSDVVPYRGGLLPVTRLNKFFGGDATLPVELTVLVIRSDRGLTGLIVDRVKTQREIVVRPLQDPLLRVPGLSGATELGDGRAILILDPVVITDGASSPLAAFDAEPATTAAP